MCPAGLVDKTQALLQEQLPLEENADDAPFVKCAVVTETGWIKVLAQNREEAIHMRLSCNQCEL